MLNVKLKSYKYGNNKTITRAKTTKTSSTKILITINDELN